MIPSNLQKYQLKPKLFTKAMTHRSYLNESSTSESNERLEFLGDAILEHLISETLYTRFPDQPEGVLTAMRSQLVQTQTLSKVAQKINLGEHLRLARGEEQAGGRQNSSLLENALEALIGAIYLSSGIDNANSFLKDYLYPEIDTLSLDNLKDPKSDFQEKIQAEGLPTPIYQVTHEEGPDHDKIFTIQVMVGADIWGEGQGKSKQQAQQQAASQGLIKLQNQQKTIN